MRIQKFLLGALMFISLISCKDNKSEIVVEEGKLPETFDVTFNLTVLKDDTFQLYFTQDGTMNFGDALSVKSIVKGSDKPQDIIFKMPVDVLPSNIRLDLGENKDQANVVVNSIKLKYFSKIFEAKENLVKNYFYILEEQAKYDEKTSTIVMVNPAGKAHDPMMWSNELLGVELKKLIK